MPKFSDIIIKVPKASLWSREAQEQVFGRGRRGETSGNWRCEEVSREGEGGVDCSRNEVPAADYQICCGIDRSLIKIQRSR